MKISLRQLACAGAALTAASLVISCGPPATNDGRESGYYADFNRVSNALVSIPGVTITNVFINRDITLEEFSFEITTASGEPAHLDFGERDPVRRMAHPELVQALKKEIAQQLSSTNR